jgi:hypothetical protein
MRDLGLSFFLDYKRFWCMFLEPFGHAPLVWLEGVCVPVLCEYPPLQILDAYDWHFSEEN